MGLDLGEFEKFTDWESLKLSLGQDLQFFNRKSPADYCIPDGVLGPFFDGLHREMRPYSSHAPRELRLGSISIADAVNFSYELCKALGPEHYVFACNTAKLKVMQRSSESRGECNGFGHIRLWPNGSLDDAFTLAHEVGHVLGKQGFLVFKRGVEKKVVSEIHGFFLQEMAYDYMQTSGSVEQQEEARMHRQQLHLRHHFLFRPMGLATLALLRKKKSQAKNIIAATNGRVNFNQLENYISEIGTPAAARMSWEHSQSYSFSAPLSVKLYGNFKVAGSRDRSKMLHVLYQGGSSTGLKQVLNVFGIETPEHLHSAAKYAVSSTMAGLKMPDSRPNSVLQIN